MELLDCTSDNSPVPRRKHLFGKGQNCGSCFFLEHTKRQAGFAMGTNIYRYKVYMVVCFLQWGVCVCVMDKWYAAMHMLNTEDKKTDTI